MHAEYIADSWTMSQWEAERNHNYEWHAEVLEGERLAAMSTLVNAWEWNPGYGNGGENPHVHPDGWAPAYRADKVPEFVMLAVHGPNTGLWYVVKCNYTMVTARQLNELTGRPTVRRMQPNPGGVGSYEVPYLYLEPYEVCVDTFILADDAHQAAKQWAAELRTAWALEEGDSMGEEIPVDPYKMGTLQRLLVSDSEAMLAEILDRVTEEEELARVT